MNSRRKREFTENEDKEMEEVDTTGKRYMEWNGTVEETKTYLEL